MCEQCNTRQRTTRRFQDDITDTCDCNNGCNGRRNGRCNNREQDGNRIIREGLAQMEEAVEILHEGLDDFFSDRPRQGRQNILEGDRCIKDGLCETIRGLRCVPPGENREGIREIQEGICEIREGVRNNNQGLNEICRGRNCVGIQHVCEGVQECEEGLQDIIDGLEDMNLG